VKIVVAASEGNAGTSGVVKKISETIRQAIPIGLLS
jgi:hypothetical protein